jgi:hypothetical protein
MQKLPLLFVLLAISVSCGGAQRPSPSPSPSPAAIAGAFDGQGLGGIQLASSSAPVAPSNGSGAGSTPRATSERARPSVSADSATERVDVLDGRSADSFGDYVRSRSAQMNFCYKEALNAYPKLAGAINLAVTVASSGDVTRVEVTKRSWSGPGTEQVEGCIRAKIRAWKLPASEAQATTFPLTLSFTK